VQTTDSKKKIKQEREKIQKVLDHMLPLPVFLVKGPSHKISGLFEVIATRSL
jgi:hypothetical protein